MKTLDSTKTPLLYEYIQVDKNETTNVEKGEGIYEHPEKVRSEVEKLQEVDVKVGYI